ncbi:MAG: FliM/FliN family flagellar motor switch protein [Phycisphaerales bacterium]|nr:MAG: FliM/FliN family flagellar motor switch protein [Phycisphaerales bacterium]
MSSQADIDALLAEADSLATQTDADLRAADSVSQGQRSSPASPVLETPTDRLPEDLQRVLNVEVPLIVRLAQRPIPVSRIIKWVPGSIIEFEKSADGPLDIMTSNTCIGFGSAVKVGENFGVRITSMINARGKLQAMASG